MPQPAPEAGVGDNPDFADEMTSLAFWRGSRMRGAARGAAAGAAATALQNNQYDNATDALKEANREDKSKSRAAADMAVSEDDWQKSYGACMAQDGSTPK